VQFAAAFVIGECWSAAIRRDWCENLLARERSVRLNSGLAGGFEVISRFDSVRLSDYEIVGGNWD
jgi:hypothetical protein